MSGNGFLTDLEVEERIQEMSDRELLEFTARQVHNHSKRIAALESTRRKVTGTWAGIGTFVGAAVVAAINFFRSSS